MQNRRGCNINSNIFANKELVKSCLYFQKLNISNSIEYQTKKKQCLEKKKFLIFYNKIRIAHDCENSREDIHYISIPIMISPHGFMTYQR